MAFSSKKYYHRDLSWLRFNHRVLQEVADTTNPLYERIKFLAIFSSNLDEFFKVRVSNIRRIKNLDKPLRKKLITKPNKLLKAIKKQVQQQQEEFGQLFTEQILPELQKEGIHLISCQDFNAQQQQAVTAYFETHLQELVTITEGIDQDTEDLFIENEELYLTGLQDNEKLLLVKIPSDTPRFVTLPEHNGAHYITFVDDVIKYHLAKTYVQHQTSDFYAIKISRDAELYIENEYSGDLLSKIQDSLGNRDTGQVTRLLVDKAMPPEVLAQVTKLLDANETDVSMGGRYHNFKDFFGFPNPTSQNFHEPPLVPKQHPDLVASTNIFDAIAHKDKLLYYPYESFEDTLRLVQTAATDPQVTKISITLYRVAKQSGVADALLAAAKNGKNVFAFIETKARFDEKNNIRWGKILADNGATVMYSYPAIKVHSKILLIERMEDEKPVKYAYVSTGNFNEKTAKIYTDFALMTAQPKITDGIQQVFQILQRKSIVPTTKNILISPFTTRTTFRKLIENEIQHAQEGKDAYIILKLNSLQDQKMIDLLYKANNAGVRIRLVVRGICCLIPGIEGQSEHIYVTSIVDRFLEHGRVYIFGNGGDEKMYIGSADWMTRNLDHRIEVIVPILDPDVYAKIRQMVQFQLDDTVKARIIDPKQQNHYVQNTQGIRSQLETLTSL